MNGFEPTLLGIVTYVITISQVNEALQSLLIIATLVYTRAVEDEVEQLKIEQREFQTELRFILNN